MKKQDLLGGLAATSLLLLCCGWHVLALAGGFGIVSGLLASKLLLAVASAILLLAGFMGYLFLRKWRGKKPTSPFAQNENSLNQLFKMENKNAPPHH